MKTKKYLILSVAAALVVSGVTVFNSQAAEASARQRPLRARLMERAKQRPGLSDEQTAQIRAIVKSEKDNLNPLLTRLHDARASLRQAIQAPSATESSVRAASAKVAAVEADFAVERLKLFTRISPILTDEQRTKLAGMQQRMDEVIDTIIARAGERLAE